MKKLVIALAGLLIIFSSLASAQEDYVFRNNVRPEYNNNISQDDFSALQSKGDFALIDVRLSEDFALDPILIPGAEYKDPENISKWALEIPKDQKVILYCVKGAWVSHKAATYLSEQGYDVTTLDGGIRDWKLKNNK
jgi:rhodanese-related sulfurtransferase